jgi:taurine dehydrogenase small subunit
MYGELTRRLSREIVACIGHRHWGGNRYISKIPRRGSEEILMTIKDLEAFFGNGWNRHDVDALMAFMADDCVFEGVAGPDVCGTRYEGCERVREAFARIFTTIPDVMFDDARHFVTGDRGVSEWTFRATTGDGKKLEVNGCDLFTFRDGKIAVKSSYFKNRTA